LNFSATDYGYTSARHVIEHDCPSQWNMAQLQRVAHSIWWAVMEVSQVSHSVVLFSLNSPEIDYIFPSAKHVICTVLNTTRVNRTCSLSVLHAVYRQVTKVSLSIAISPLCVPSPMSPYEPKKHSTQLEDTILAAGPGACKKPRKADAGLNTGKQTSDLHVNCPRFYYRWHGYPDGTLLL